ncbi:ABC transporter substrate-binding protein [Streptomyces sp. RK75]|uniref:ABC transporter substrate-binding protein n=1 Tax=Streptomyces sp. RK75 TaxID=2824895 RepID=UPI001B35DBF0|nr:ABC transporter substrate-binding protein [Streptomyces sp. RK75]MBQ0862266.1 carbohydrate ABC transporter substrate-binding protein [Streptomyces sp. RK75]
MLRFLRTPALLATAFSAVIALSGCGQAPVRTTPNDFTLDGRPRGHLTVLEKWADPQYAPYFERMAEEYERRNPGVTIELQAVGDQPYKDRIAALAASRDLPDIYFAWPGQYAERFADGRLAADLTSQLSDTAWGRSFVPDALHAYRYDGRNYGVPVTLDAKVFAYNRRIFRKAGVKGEPRTFAQLLSACDRIRKAGWTPITFGNQYGWPVGHLLTQLNAMHVPPDTLAKDYAVRKGGGFRHPGYVRAFTDLRRLKERCFAPGGSGASHENAQTKLVYGKAAMQYLETVEFPFLTEKGGAPASFERDWGFFPMPPAPEGQGDPRALAGGTDGLMVSNNSPDKALAVDFLKFLTARPQAREMVRELGWLSAVQDTSRAGRVKGLGAAQRLIDSRRMSVWLDTRTDNKVVNPTLAAADSVLGGRTSPQEAVRRVRKAADQTFRFSSRGESSHHEAATPGLRRDRHPDQGGTR